LLVLNASRHQGELNRRSPFVNNIQCLHSPNSSIHFFSNFPINFRTQLFLSIRNHNAYFDHAPYFDFKEQTVTKISKLDSK
jgi:hypothetical protein